ncbi:hypothetical protein V7068_11650 [Bacillus sp. JJ634]
MYRPTVRYDDVFKEYIDSLFHATHLDRNQIIRAALFAAAYSKEFLNLLTEHKKKDVPLPPPLWERTQHGYWMEQSPKIRRTKGGRDVNDIHERATTINKNIGAVGTGRRNGKEQSGCIKPIKGQSREIHGKPIRIENQGGITLTIN